MGMDRWQALRDELAEMIAECETALTQVKDSERRFGWSMRRDGYRIVLKQMDKLDRLAEAR